MSESTPSSKEQAEAISAGIRAFMDSLGADGQNAEPWQRIIWNGCSAFLTEFERPQIAALDAAEQKAKSIGAPYGSWKIRLCEEHRELDCAVCGVFDVVTVVPDQRVKELEGEVEKAFRRGQRSPYWMEPYQKIVEYDLKEKP